ncbi:hypothetical protein AB0N09_14895 [Streptomyces erythrochromogenes]
MSDDSEYEGHVDRIPGHRDLVRATALGDGPHRLRAVDTLSA